MKSIGNAYYRAMGLLKKTICFISSSLTCALRFRRPPRGSHLALLQQARMHQSLFKTLLSVGAILVLSGCETFVPKSEPQQNLDVMKILNQVNTAIQSSIEPTNKDFPPLTSVTLDLQVAVTTAVDASLKFPVVLTTGGKANHEKLHQITLTFTPNTSKRVPSSETKDSKLGTAIRAVYQSVANANSAFQLHNGVIKLQCTLKSELDGGISVLGLVPIQSDASLANQTVQTLTLNFGNPVATRVLSVPQDSSSQTPVN